MSYKGTANCICLRPALFYEWFFRRIECDLVEDCGPAFLLYNFRQVFEKSSGDSFIQMNLLHHRKYSLGSEHVSELIIPGGGATHEPAIIMAKALYNLAMKHLRKKPGTGGGLFDHQVLMYITMCINFQGHEVSGTFFYVPCGDKITVRSPE